jgi:hypothetical protein
MGESFVDLSYRGLDLGKRLKLTDFHVDAGYVEIPLPMPVGTRVEIATDDGMRIEAMVTHVHEQVAGSDRKPGMRLVPSLTGKAKEWWTSQVDRAAVAREEQRARHRRESQLQVAEEIAAAQAAAAEAAAAAKAAAAAEPVEPMSPANTARGIGVVGVTDTPAAAMGRPTMQMSPETLQAALAAAADDGLVDDGKRTEMMAAVEPSSVSSGSFPVVDDVKSTTVMDAIDISMITGEAPPDVGIGDAEEAEITVESDDDMETSGEISTEMPATASGATSTNGKKKSRSKRKKKR